MTDRRADKRQSYLELVFKPTESFQFNAELKRGENGVATRQCYQRRTGKCTVGVDSRPGVLEAVISCSTYTLITATPSVVWPRHRVTSVQQNLHDLVVVAMRSKDNRRHISCKRTARDC